MFKVDGSPRSPEVIQVMTGRNSVEDGEIPRMPSVICVFGSLPAGIRLIGFPRLIILPRKRKPGNCSSTKCDYGITINKRGGAAQKTGMES